MRQDLLLSLGPFIHQLYSEWLDTESPAKGKADPSFGGRERTQKKERSTGSTSGEDVLATLRNYLFSKYDFRFNVLTEQTEFRSLDMPGTEYVVVEKRMLNTLVIEARNSGIRCWDKDVERLLRSNFIPDYHPFIAYMEGLPEWDGVDRIETLAKQVDEDALWVDGFRRWLLGLAAQWMGIQMQCANTLIPILISSAQGWGKSTFCRSLVPPELRVYYLDKFDLTANSNVEQKLGRFGLINLDEFDRYSPAAMATLKNLVQLQDLTVRKAYASYYSKQRRIASFIGTSNQMDLLSDPSGSRRFLCVELKRPIAFSPVEYNQLFAQLKYLVKNGERVWMNRQEELDLQEHNRVFYRLSPEQEVFFQCFDIPKEGDADTELYSASELFHILCQCNPAAMRGTTVVKLGRSLSGMHLRKEHTKYGNKYRVKVRKQRSCRQGAAELRTGV